MINKVIRSLFGTRASGLYILIFATAIGAATFVENDFGTSAAQKLIYQSWWFTSVLVLFGGSIIANVFRYRMIPQKKWALAIFHLAIIVILIGAGLTRYLGYEGVMHIRQGATVNQFMSAETYLQFEVNNRTGAYRFEEQVLFASIGDQAWQESYLLGTDLIKAKVLNFIPNPVGTLINRENGRPTIHVVMGGAEGREDHFISQGETKRIKGTVFNFNKESQPGAINLSYTNGELFIQTNRKLKQTVMATQQQQTLLPGPEAHPLMLRSLYTDGISSFVFKAFEEKGQWVVTSSDPKVRKESTTAVKLELWVNDEAREVLVYGKKGIPGRKVPVRLGGVEMSVSYGAKMQTLPFSVHLYEFIMERYPGTNNAAAYASEVQLIDSRKNLKANHRIYMNHVLNHDGYRFFQSSFDRDEQGTYLSVNHDYWGSIVSYFGYFLLTAGMILSLFNSKGRFKIVTEALRSRRIKRGLVVSMYLLLCLPVAQVFGQKQLGISDRKNLVSSDHAQLFSTTVVQDHRGRMKPMHTLSREILRKVSRKENIDGVSADQIILSLFANSKDWMDVPLIRLGKHEAIYKQLGVSAKRATYKDFFDENGQYKLKVDVRAAYKREAIDRSTYDKELLKIDERVNILNMVFSGRMFKVVPLSNDENNTWVANEPGHHGHQHDDGHDHSSIADKFFSAYRGGLNQAMTSGDYSYCNQLIRELHAYQAANGGSVMPDAKKIEMEIGLNKMKVFDRLALMYALLGLAYLILLFYSVFQTRATLNLIYKVLFGLMIAGFVFHTIGLGMRWYVSERAPWSNGYESMIYIAWSTTLAGICFARKSLGALAATMILAATVLLVALLSHMDPEITPLVPVLKSYWLTIHVSLEAGSYGFLMLGAVIGLINLILMTFLANQNKTRIHDIVVEMTYLSELILMGGLIMISTGTYLGGIWANESWGRYWGWDAKETWALVTILIYAFILHMRIIPKLNGLYAFNLATIFGLASVIMTYYGVNYYLSGLHSYATGDPVPIPTWVYLMVSGIMGISILAYWKKRKYKLVNA